MVLSFINLWVISIISDETYYTIYSTASEYIFPFLKFRKNKTLIKRRNTIAE